MGNSRLVKTILVCLILSSSSIFANSYSEYLKKNQKSYVDYRQKTIKEFGSYQDAQSVALKEFYGELGLQWKVPKISTKHRWVEYSKDLTSRKSVDFKKEEIILEVIASNEKEAKEKIVKIFDALLQDDVSSAYKNDILEHKINKLLKKTNPKKLSNKKIIGDIISASDRQRLRQKLREKKLTVIQYKDKFIYKINVKLPSSSMQKKAKTFKIDILEESAKQKIPPALVYAIMHSESSFNPMARSHVPAFGLMQIVPHSAGIDSYYYLYGKKKLLSSEYLYDSKKNIKIGTAYLHILYYKYLRKIKDPQSRLYCTIAAYNTGSGNVARAFTKRKSMSKAAPVINAMTADEVYKTLLKKLPYDETKHYLKKVNKRVSSYEKFLQASR